MTIKQTYIGTVPKMIMIPPEYIERIKPILRRHNLTFSAFAREALKMALEAYEKEDEKEEAK